MVGNAKKPKIKWVYLNYLRSSQKAALTKLDRKGYQAIGKFSKLYEFPLRLSVHVSLK